MEIWFPGSIDIPCNAGTETVTLIGGERRNRLLQLNAARFETNDFTIEILKEKNWLKLHAVSASSLFTDSITNGILESLQFVLARPLEWSIMQVHQGKERVTKIKDSLKNEIPRRGRPPIHPREPSHNKQVWDLFDKYFTYALSQNRKSTSSIFSHLWPILLARSSSFPTEVLTLGIALEGILKEHFDKKVPEATIKEQICKARQIISQSDLTNNVKTRILGFIPSLQHPRTKDQLYSLQERSLINEQLIKAWEELRNRAAHAGQIDPEKAQHYIDRCHAVTALLHQLIFLAIGYNGIYTDYSSYGFPQKEFLPTTDIYTPNTETPHTP